MECHTPCPLTPALIELLQVAANIKDTRDSALSDALCQSPHTIKSKFKRIAEALGTHSRAAAIIKAADEGWISLSPPLTLPTTTSEDATSTESPT